MARVFSVSISFDDGSSRISAWFYDSDEAARHLCKLADQRLTPLAEAPRMKTVYLYEGETLVLPMRVVRVN